MTELVLRNSSIFVLYLNLLQFAQFHFNLLIVGAQQHIRHLFQSLFILFALPAMRDQSSGPLAWLKDESDAPVMRMLRLCKLMVSLQM